MQVRSDADPASPGHGTTFTLHVPMSMPPANEGRKPSARLGGAVEEIRADTSNPVATNMEKKEIV